MRLRTKLMMFTAAVALSANMAFAAIDANALADAYLAEGYNFVEVKVGPTQTKVEAIRGTTKVEVIYDNETQAIIKREEETADGDDVGRTGKEVKTVDGDFEDGDDDDDDDDDDDNNGGGENENEGDDNLDPVKGYPVSGNYCKASGGVGLTFDSAGTFPMNITGQPVRAYLYWAGRYPSSSAGDNAVQISINGGLPLIIIAEQTQHAKLGDGTTYHTYQSANLVNDVRFTGLLTGDFTVTAWGLRSAGLATDEGYGIGLVVISEDQSCPEGQISLFYGLDSFVHTGSGELGPNSDTLCVQFPAAATPRMLDFDTFVGGAEGVNALWHLVGSGTPPKELITNHLGTILDGPPLTALSPLVSNTGQQWDRYTNKVAIPAGATFACFQFESVAPVLPNGAPGTSAVWVNFVAQLFTNNGTSTATPTATPTPSVTTQATVPTVPATPTPTATQTPQGQPGFTLDISIDPANPQPGEDIIYTLEYENTGQVTLNNLVLRLTIPAQTTFNRDASTDGWICNGTGPGSICEFNLGNVEAGEKGTVLFVVTLDANLAALTEPIILTVQAYDADRTIEVEANSDVITTIKRQGFRSFLPIVNK